MDRKCIALGVTIGSFVLLSGCVETLEGFKVVGLDLVDAQDRRDRDRPTDHPRRSRLLMMARVSAATTDLGRYAAHGFSVGNDTSICGENGVDPSKPLQHDPYVFDAKATTDHHLEAPLGETSEESMEPVYHVFFDARPVELMGSDTFWYDLKARPEDVCILIHGGTMTGESYSTNVIRIPSALIAHALRDSQK